MSAASALTLLVAAGVAVRLAMFFVYQPAVYPDTGTYHTLASQIAALDFTGYQAIRTPGYALLLLLAGQNHVAVWGLQAALGVAISVLLFRICLAHTASPGLALAAGLAHTLAINQLFFEANVLGETLTTFFVVLSVAFLARALPSRDAGSGVAAGLSSAFATLTRPAYLYLGPLLAILVLCFERKGKRLAAYIALACLAPLLAWAMFNKAQIGHFGLTTNAGYGLTNHSGRFIEHAPEEYAQLRDIYLKHREQKIAETGSSSATIFLARDEMRQQTGLDHLALSQRLTRLSLELFAAQPALYLRSVAEAWASFWAVPLYVRWENFTSQRAARLVETAFPVQRALLLLVNLLAVAASAWVIASSAWRRFKGADGLSMPMIVSCTLVAASVLQALAEFGENPRYGIPTQSLAVTLVLMALWDLRRLHAARRVAGRAGAIAASAP